MSGIEYRTTDVKEIDLIRPLWIQLNDYMHGKAGTFRSHYEKMSFDERKAYFAKVAAAGTLRLDLSFDPQAGGKYIGYCVSSLSQEKTGEIESIFVEEKYRSQNIGSALVIRALAWFDEKGSVRNRVAASAGNEGVWDFYKKFGFYPRMMVLEQKKE
jgi:GNAT superfamily N-acetyltransferase